MIGATIDSHFKPVQPTVKAGDIGLCYQETAPLRFLKPYVYCYWQLKTKEKLAEPYLYRVVSDGCVDVFFNLKQMSESFVMGFCKKYTSFSIGHEFNYGGVRFYPSAFTQLFGISAKLLRDKDQPLRDVLPQFADILSQSNGYSMEQIIHLLNDYLYAIVRENEVIIDDRFYSALLLICKEHGNLETERDLNVGISPRQLRRSFEYYIGTTPKSFSQIVRFQFILNSIHSTDALKNNKIYYDVGFHDQAHFIKTFTKFYGVTPSKAFR